MPYEHINLLTVSSELAVKQIVEWLSGDGENDYEDYSFFTCPSRY